MDDLRLFHIPNRESNIAPDEDHVLKSYYDSWRRTNRDGFTIIYNDFRDKHLADLAGGPLRLYLFLSFAAANEGGGSYYSVNKIAELLKTSPRSVDSWIKVLVDRQLIARGKTGRRVNNTYLLPYSTTLIELQTPKKFDLEDWQRIFDFHLARISQYQDIYGELIGAFHLFQWDYSNRKPVSTSNSQLILFITKRTDGILTGHYYKLRRSQGFGISKLMIDKMVRFESPLLYEQRPLVGLGLNHNKRLTEITNNKALKVVTEQLSKFSKDDDDLFEHVVYGNVDEVLAPEEDSKTQNEQAETDGAD